MKWNDKTQAIVAGGILLGLLIVTGVYTYQTVTKNRLTDSAAGVALFGEESNDEVQYTTLDGSDVALSDYLGKVLYINTWASWSPLSGPELTTLNEVAAAYQDRDIVFLALNRKETHDQAARFVASLPPLPHVTLVIDTTDQFYGAVGGYAMPETVVYNAAGEVLYHERTPQTRDQMTALIEAALATD